MPTVYLVGVDQLGDIPSFLELGAVVVIAPDRTILRDWQEDQDPTPSRATERSEEGLVVNLAKRTISWDGRDLRLSDREFQVLAALAAEPRRAWSFRDLRRIGWADEPDIGLDMCSLRAMMQRLRLKLRSAGMPLQIEAVRGYGFRFGEEGSRATLHTMESAKG